MSAVSVARRHWPTAPPDGLLACVLLAFLASAGLFYVNVMPAIVSGLKDGLGFSNTQAGYVASANIYGAACGALTAVFLVGRVPWKPAEAAALCLLLLFDLASMFVTAPHALIVLRAVHGFCGGISVGLGLAIMARTRVPDRAFGMLLTVQFGAGALGLSMLPELAQRQGTWVLFAALAAFTLVTLAMLPFLAAYPPRPVSTLPQRVLGGGSQLPLLATLLALFLFQGANMGLFAFIIPLGRHYGLGTPFISETLGVSNVVAVLGSLFVIWSGARFGRRLPILVAMSVSVLGTAVLLRSNIPALFVVANVGTGIMWSFMVPCLFAMCAEFDTAGRSVTLGGFCSKMGLASGPLAAPFVIGAEDYGRLVAAAVAILVLCALAALGPATMIDGERQTT